MPRIQLHTSLAVPFVILCLDICNFGHRLSELLLFFVLFFPHIRCKSLVPSHSLRNPQKIHSEVQLNLEWDKNRVSTLSLGHRGQKTKKCHVLKGGNHHDTF